LPCLDRKRKIENCPLQSKKGKDEDFPPWIRFLMRQESKSLIQERLRRNVGRAIRAIQNKIV
jgi:hypothetical protein